MYLLPKVRLAKEAMGWEARSQYRGEPLTGSVQVSIALYWPDNRKHDIDNGLKVLLDALTGILWLDDAQITELRIRKAHDKANPRIEFEALTI